MNRADQFKLETAANNKHNNLGAMRHCKKEENRGGCEGKRLKSAWMKLEPHKKNYTTFIYFINRNKRWYLEKIEGDCNPILRILSTQYDPYNILVSLAKSSQIDVVTSTSAQRAIDARDKEAAKIIEREAAKRIERETTQTVERETTQTVESESETNTKSKVLTGEDFGWSDPED